MLTETIRGLEAVRRPRDHYNGTVGGRRCIGEETETWSEEVMCSPAEKETESEAMGRGRSADEEEEEEKECKRKVVAVLRELSVFHSNGVTAWREALRKCVCNLNKSPPEGVVQQHPSTTGRCKMSWSVS